MFPITFSYCICAFALFSSSGNHVVEEYVDLIELNHFYDHQGRHVYDQVIFYERTPDTGRFHVRAWCLVEDRDSLNRRPVKNAQTQLYQVDWYDNDQRLQRKLTSHLFRESWSQVDPERADKKLHDERSRIALVQNPKKLFAERHSRQLEEQKQPCSEINPRLVVSNSTTPPTSGESQPAAAQPEASQSAASQSAVQPIPPRAESSPTVLGDAAVHR